MDTHDINRASGLLRQRAALKNRIESLDPFARSGLLELSTSRPVLPTDTGAHRISGGTFSTGTEVAIDGETLKIVTDLVGSLLSRQLEEVERQLADLGVTDTMTAQATDAAAAEKQPCGAQDFSGIEVMVFTVSDPDGAPCDCPACQTLRATA